MPTVIAGVADQCPNARLDLHAGDEGGQQFRAALAVALRQCERHRCHRYRRVSADGRMHVVIIERMSRRPVDERRLTWAVFCTEAQ